MCYKLVDWFEISSNAKATFQGKWIQSVANSNQAIKKNNILVRN